MVATKRARRIFVLVLTLALTLAMYALVHAADGEYTIQIDFDSDMGSVTVNGAENNTIKIGDDFSVNAKAKNGYVFDGWELTTGSAVTVTTDSAISVQVTSGSAITTGSAFEFDAEKAEQTFKAPGFNVGLKALFSKKSSEGGSSSTGSSSSTRKQFVDVPKASYYYDAVYWALDKNITEGTDATHFSPMSGVKRADFVLFLYRHAGSPKVSGTMPFTDVPANAYYHDAVLWAYQKGITEGTSETTFSPLKTVTRAQAVTFLYRMAGEPEITAENNFSDVDEDAYYFEAVLWAIKNGITDGTSKTTFSPDNTCNRAQAITFIYRDLK
ncbi:MAG: S-layer homology domain-containing protein [Firmicutes bacterium]|nr:S-layer homology domain-containing protein [Bacillota bacterium]MBQ5437132.1 S-layer homology domain-containing protein [Bacillota bacterium]